MNKNIETILQELLAIDPSFASHESELRVLISELLAKKPDTRLDEQFVAQLRERLLGMPTPSPIRTFFSGRYAVLAVLALLLVAPISYLATRGQSGAAIFAMNQEVQTLKSGAFGTLQPQSVGLDAGGGRESAMMSAGSAQTTSADAEIAYTNNADARMMIPSGPFTVYNYVYKGEPLELTDAEGAVYSRVKNQATGGQIAAQLRKFNFGLIDLGAYADARVRSFELVQDKPYGYSIGVSFDEGTVSISAHYPQWPTMNGKETPQPLSKADMPSKDALVAIAKSFLDEHNVSLENFGEPVIQDFSAYLFATEATAETMPAIPDQVSITFPLKIRGTEVIEEGAYPYGLQVSISVRDRRVVSLYGLNAQTYSSSNYPLTTDSSNVLAVLGKGGPQSWIPEAGQGIEIKKIDVEVGTPTKVLMHTYNYSATESFELFVPALKFPVIKPDEEAKNAPDYVVIPLVPDLLNKQPGPVLYDATR